MPLIANPVKCDAAHLEIITLTKASGDFSHRSWGCDDLLPVRSFIRSHYRNEQRGICAYCKERVSTRTADNAHVEHIAPKSLYIDFMFEEKNLCVICADCNVIKRSQETINEIPDTLAARSGTAPRRQYPRSSNAFLIVHPHFDDWDDHIEKFGVRYTDKTDKGIFTIQACKLNRYFHNNFNVDDEYLDDDQLHKLMSDWIDAPSSVQKARILSRLATSLSKMNIA